MAVIGCKTYLFLKFNTKAIAFPLQFLECKEKNQAEKK